jgi:hypothetical protein
MQQLQSVLLEVGPEHIRLVSDSSSRSLALLALALDNIIGEHLTPKIKYYSFTGFFYTISAFIILTIFK